MHSWDYTKKIEESTLNLLELSPIEKSFFSYKIYYCTKCGLIKHLSLTGINHYYRQFYREYAKSFGWGVMIGYDTVIAESKKKAKRQIPIGMYGKDFDLVIPVKAEHLSLSDDSLHEIYTR
jgi:hypothetical protein